MLFVFVGGSCRFCVICICREAHVAFVLVVFVGAHVLLCYLYLFVGGLMSYLLSLYLFVGGFMSYLRSL